MDSSPVLVGFGRWLRGGRMLSVVVKSRARFRWVRRPHLCHAAPCALKLAGSGDADD
jgi:hypothetical protein